MRLRRLDLTRYGKFTGRSLDFGPRPEGAPDLHIVHGLNEAGKSTAFSAWLDLLFGVEPRSPYGFLHPYATMEIGAALDVAGATRELRRVKRQTHSLLDAQGRPADEGALAAALAGLTRDSYAAMFSLDDATLEQGGEAILDSKGELGALLFSASAGLAAAAQALDAMNGEADELHRKRASKTRVAELKRRIADLKARRDAIDVQASAYEKLAQARALAQEEYERAATALGDARAKRDGLARLLRARPLCDDYDRAATRLAALAACPRPPASWRDEQRALASDDLLLRNEASGLERRAGALAQDIAGLAPDARILDLGFRIDQLAALDDRYATAEVDLPKRRAALDAQDASIAATLRALGVAAGADPHGLIVAAPVAATLRDLVEARSGVEARLAAARREVETARAALAQARDARARLDAGDDDAARLATLRAALARLRGDPQARLRQAEREAAEKRAAAREALAALAPWAGDGAALAALPCPHLRRLEGWRAAAQALAARGDALRQSLRDLAGAAREDAARLAAARAAALGLDDARASAARAEREAAWSRHLATLDADTARLFEAAMRSLDALDAARLAKADDVAQARHVESEAARRAAQTQHNESLLADLAAEVAALGREIAAEAPIPLDEARPLAARLGALERWLAAREAALARSEAATRAEAARESAALDAQEARAALAGALAPFGVAADALALDALAAAAETALADAAARRAAREAADTALARGQADLAARETAAAHADAAQAAWDRKWRGALAATWFEDRADAPAAVRALLDALATLPGDLSARAEMAQRIAAMERDQTALREGVAALYAALGEDAPDAPRAGAQRLTQRLAAARQDARRKSDRQTDLERLGGERDKLDAALRLHDARKAERLAFFGVADLVALDAALDACAERDRLETAQAERAASLLAETQAPSLDAARAALAGIDIEATARQASDLDDQIALCETRARELFADQARAQDALARVGGDAEAARLDAERRVALIELEEAAKSWLRLRAGALIAGRALRDWRETHRSAMMTRASHAFALITRGAYAGLTTRGDAERETLIALSAEGGSKLVGDLSKGARFQLYLALRLAGYEEFAQARDPVPFVADDILETFDEPRSEEAFRLFARMAATGQVIYLTHHRHLCDIARRAAPGAQVHELD